MRRLLVIYDFATALLNFLIHEENLMFFLSVQRESKRPTAQVVVVLSILKGLAHQRDMSFDDMYGQI